MGSAVPAPCFSLGSLHELQSFQINPVWIFHRLTFLWCGVLLGLPTISALASAAPPYLPPAFNLVFRWLLRNIFCPTSNPLSQRCPHLVARLGPVVCWLQPGHPWPLPTEADNYTECNDLEKWLLKMTEKGVGCITCLQLSVRKKKPLIPNNPHSGSTTDSTLADFPLHAHLTELLNPQLLPSLLNQILD